MLVDYNVVRDEVFDLLLKSGFCEDLFYIKVNWNGVIVMFDVMEAVDYFRGDFDYSDLSQMYEYRYEADGKRHCAVISKKKNY